MTNLIEYHVISSGSHGNCVVINNLMVDCGVPFKKIKNYLYEIDYLFITHIHSDHLNKSTIKSIRKMFPHVKIIANYEVAMAINVDIIANEGYPVKDIDIPIVPFECVHDVKTYGFTLELNGLDVIYATDTNNLDNVPEDKKFDYFFIESNHDEAKVKIAKATRGYNPKMSALRHLSTQKARAFYYLRRKSKESKFIELHKSSRFY